MIGIDHYLYRNGLRKIHPGEKMAFACITLLLSLLSANLAIPFLVFTVMGLIIIFQARIPLSFYLKLLLLPAGFLLAGTGAIAFSISSSNFPMLWGWHWNGYFFGITLTGLKLALLVFARALGAVSCLYFLMLTTPIEEIALQLQRLKVPSILVELMLLIYRFIFVLWENAVTIHTAQAARLGHVDWKTGLRSLASLVSSLFIRSLYRADNLHLALVSRCYTGNIAVLEEEIPHSWKSISYFALIDFILLFILISKEGAFS